MATRATKIVATLGPATSDPALLVAMLRAGVNVVRLNFSHGIAQDHIDRAAAVREAAKEVGREVAIMADLQGPKIRVGKFADGKVHLVEGASFVLDAARETLGDIEAVGEYQLQQQVERTLEVAQRDVETLIGTLLGTDLRCDLCAHLPKRSMT